MKTIKDLTVKVTYSVGNINGYYNLHEEAWRSCLQRARVIGNQYENPELLNYNND